MHSILIALKKSPGDSNARYNQWCSDVEILDREAKPNEAVQILAFGCWLIRAESGLSFLGRAIYRAVEDKLEYRVLCFQDDPQLPKEVV
jgi:hypothetical protein